MNPGGKLCSETWGECSLGNKSSSEKLTPNHHHYNSQQHHRKREDASSPDFTPPLSKFCKPSEPPSSHPGNHDNQRIQHDLVNGQTKDMSGAAINNDWDPNSVLSNLSFVEQKIHQLQDLVHLIMEQDKQTVNLSNELVAQQQQLVTADLTSIIVQLISTAGSLLPSVKSGLLVNPILGQLQSLSGVRCTPSLSANNASDNNNNNGEIKLQCHSDQIEQVGSWEREHKNAGKPNLSIFNVDEQIPKDEEDAGEADNLPPGSYEVLQLEKEEILAPHTHFCLICGKGFKRDANLRMHMRGHGDEYKTPAALAKPNKEPGTEPLLAKRYSCPYAGCKRNKDHKKFQPLKTFLCVKNHYKRTHCDKSYTCSRCNSKKFSVLADLKTHEKHCGRDKWLCSCGTTFSRKDKLFGHVALFQGHTPALPVEETKGVCGTLNAEETSEATNLENGQNTGFSFSSSFSNGSGVQNFFDMKDGIDDPATFFSTLDFDTCSFGGYEFPRPPFDISESSLSCLLSGSNDYVQKTGTESGSDAFRIGKWKESSVAEDF